MLLKMGNDQKYVQTNRESRAVSSLDLKSHMNIERVEGSIASSKPSKYIRNVVVMIDISANNPRRVTSKCFAHMLVDLSLLPLWRLSC